MAKELTTQATHVPPTEWNPAVVQASLQANDELTAHVVQTLLLDK
jgi:hypothetical protein